MGHSQSLLGSSHTRRTFGSCSYMCPNSTCFAQNQPNTKDGTASQLVHDSAPKSPCHFNKLLWPLKSHTDHFFRLRLLKANLDLPDSSWESWRAPKNQKILTTRGRYWNLNFWQKPIQLMYFESPLAQKPVCQCMSEMWPCQSWKMEKVGDFDHFLKLWLYFRLLCTGTEIKWFLWKFPIIPSHAQYWEDPIWPSQPLKMHFHSHQHGKEAYIRGQLDVSMSQHLLSSALNFSQYWEDPF